MQCVCYLVNMHLSESTRTHKQACSQNGTLVHILTTYVHARVHVNVRTLTNTCISSLLFKMQMCWSTLSHALHKCVHIYKRMSMHRILKIFVYGYCVRIYVTSP